MLGRSHEFLDTKINSMKLSKTRRTNKTTNTPDKLTILQRNSRNKFPARISNNDFDPPNLKYFDTVFRMEF